MKNLPQKKLKRIFLEIEIKFRQYIFCYNSKNIEKLITFSVLIEEYNFDLEYLCSKYKYLLDEVAYQTLDLLANKETSIPHLIKIEFDLICSMLCNRNRLSKIFMIQYFIIMKMELF